MIFSRSAGSVLACSAAISSLTRSLE